MQKYTNGSTYLPTSQIDPYTLTLHRTAFHRPFHRTTAQSVLPELFDSPKQENHPIKLFENNLYIYTHNLYQLYFGSKTYTHFPKKIELTYLIEIISSASVLYDISQSRKLGPLFNEFYTIAIFFF